MEIHIVVSALMDEKFIFKWSHKIDFFRLKMNEKGCDLRRCTFTLQRRSL